MIDWLQDASPGEWFNHPPYVAELFSEVSGWSGVMNRNGINVLTFKSKPGAVVTSYEMAKAIADKWNAEVRG